LKSRFRFAPPARADGTLLPAALVALLGTMALVQLVLTDPVDLPATGPIGGGGAQAALADPGSRGVPPAFAERALFSPTALPGAAGAAGAAQAADPLGGAAILGLVGVGRARYLVVQVAGSTRRVAIGGTVAGWRVIGVSDSAALLARGRERLTRPFGAGGAAAADNSETDSSEESE
jgi:hypothetical protein